MNARTALVGIVDYQAGNIQSIENALDHLGARTFRLTSEADLPRASHILLPGVGAFGHCAERLDATGLVPALAHAVLERRTPMLGICVGMQLLADFSEEMGGSEGLGWMGGGVHGLMAHPPAIRVPHVGWNDVRFEEPFGRFRAGDCADFYFDHSFAYRNPTRGSIVGQCDHGGPFAAIIRDGNLIAAQFHPEKSQEAGLSFLSGFLEFEPEC